MFAIPGIVLLLALMNCRPQEFLTELRAVPLLYIFFGMALFGWAVDLKIRRSRPLGVPQGLSPFGCHRIDPTSTDQIGIFDGRPCDNDRECESGDVSPAPTTPAS